MKRIVALGLYVEGFGFTNVFTSLFKELRHHYEIHWIGLAHRGAPMDRGYRILPNNLQGGDMYGAYHGEQLVESTNADYVIILNDVWMLKNYRKTLGRPDRRWKTVAYVPLDGQITEAHWLTDMAYLDGLAAYTPGDARQYEYAFDQLLRAQHIEHRPSITDKAHGVDLKQYYPLEDHERKRIRAKVFPGLETDALIALNANRFHERKNLEATIAGFSRARAQCARPVYLCLHQPNLAVHQRTQLEQWITGYAVKDHVILNPLGEEYVEVSRLNELYNCCAIGINTSLGEGWGLISFEHAATGAAQIVPRHSAPESIWQNAGLFLEKTVPCMIQNNPFRMYQVSVEDLSQHLLTLAQDSNKLAHWQERAYEHARHDRFSWKSIASDWHAFLEAL